MLDDFHPLMQADNVEETARYYNDVFVPLGDVVPAMTEDNVARFQQYVAGIGGVQTDVEKLVPALAQALNMSPDQVQQFLATQFPSLAQMLQALPQMEQDLGGFVDLMDENVPIFAEVPAGLDHYRPLVSTMQANVGNYDDADSLPSFRLFTWFFVVPGALLVILAAVGLVRARRPAPATSPPSADTRDKDRVEDHAPTG